MFAGCLVMALSAHAAVAQGAKPLPPIDTDRPDLTDGTGTVARGHLQVESGYTLTYSRDGLTAYSVPELLVRIGALAGAEIRLAESFIANFQDDPAVPNSGWGDLQLGTKIRLVPQVGNRPAFSMEVFSTLPTGARGVSAGRALPGGALLAEWDGDGPWSAGIELQAARDPGQGMSWAPSLSVQYRPVDAVQFYGEVYSLQSTGPASPGESYFNTGVLLLLSNNVQVDARFGLGLNHAATRNYFGFGLALRR